MDKKTMLKILQRNTAMIWDTLCELYTPLVHYNEPTLELNPYTWRTAGSCYQEENLIQMSYKFMKYSPEYYNYMLQIILPHEIIHQADYNLFGDSEKICGHGVNWQRIMLEYGLEANPYHTMDIPKNA
jgi:predicted SprT family Zn-dependent metalloprotease